MYSRSIGFPRVKPQFGSIGVVRRRSPSLGGRRRRRSTYARCSARKGRRAAVATSFRQLASTGAIIVPSLPSAFNQEESRRRAPSLSMTASCPWTPTMAVVARRGAPCEALDGLGLDSPPMLAKRFPDRVEIAAARVRADELEPGATRRVGDPEARGPRARAARPGEDRVPRPRRPKRQDPAPRARAGRPRGGGSQPGRHRRRQRASGQVAPRRALAPGERARAAREDPRPASRHLPRPDGRGAALSQALPRPLDQRRDAAFVRDPNAGRDRDPELPRRGGLPRGGDARAPTTLRRRLRDALQHALQRARPGHVPADRDRALPQAADRRRARARLRARQGLQERGLLVQELARVHDARVVRGLRRLQRTRWCGWRRSSSGSRRSRSGPRGSRSEGTRST